MKPHQHRHHHDDDDDDRILKDGERMRVPMRMCDSLQRQVARHFGTLSDDAGPLRITDTTGSRFGLHRPGFRIATGGNEDAWLDRAIARDAVEEARAAYEEELTNAWRNPPTSRCVEPSSEADDGCTLDGPGHLGMDGGQQQCLPDRATGGTPITDARAAAYTEYEEFLRNAWRGHS
jgi:hypothetical protein